MALKFDGRVFSWGNNGNGRLGIGVLATDRSSPVQVINESDFIAIAAGNGNALALKSDGRVFTWGNGAVGRLGLGTDDLDRSTPTQVVNESEFKAISAQAASQHCLALKSDGRVFAWGLNASGQLGTGDADSRSTPTQVINESDFVSIVAGNGHSLALKSDGRIFSWGTGNSGQLGNVTTISRSTPRELYITPLITMSNSNKVFTETVVPNTTYNVTFINGQSYFNNTLIGYGSNVVIWYAV
jgi:alpha-tubulin suppressor-like RCC1 family protein